jgi:hypothetical protein
MTPEKEIKDRVLEIIYDKWQINQIPSFNRVIDETIQLTQSKIIQIIDKRIEELKKNIDEYKGYWGSEFLTIPNDLVIKELESLKKEVKL